MLPQCSPMQKKYGSEGVPWRVGVRIFVINVSSAAAGNL